MFHTCHPAQGVEHKFTCSICNKTFGTICQLHDHFVKCSQDDSFIYFKKYKVVFPLSSLWALMKSRDFSSVKEFTVNSEPNCISGNHEADLNELLIELCHSYSSTDWFPYKLQDGKEHNNDSTDTSDLGPLIGEDKLTVSSKEITPEKLTFDGTEGEKKVRRSFKKVGKDSAKLRMIKQKLHNKLVVSTGIWSQYSVGTCLNSVSTGMCNDEHGVETLSRINSHSEDSAIKNDQYISDGRPKNTPDINMNGVVQKTIPVSLVVTETDVEGSVTLVNNNIPVKKENTDSYEVTNPEAKMELVSDSEINTVEKGRETLETIPLKKKLFGRRKGQAKSQRLQRSSNSGIKQRKKSSDNSVKKQRKKLSDSITVKEQNVKSQKTPVQKKCGPTRLECLICGRKVKNLDYHMVSHSDVYPYKCEICPKAYKYRFHLATHLKSHSDVLPYYCEICGQGFIEACRLRMHSFTHSDYRPHKCELCDAGFLTQSMLKRHMLIHTGVKKMQCHLCGMSFSRRDHLTVHISSVHKKERRFSCEDCGKTFFTNYQLKCHAMKHSGLRPYKCQLCKADYIERKELRRHMKKQHNMLLDNKSVLSTVDQMEADQSVNENSTAERPPVEIFSLTHQSGANSESISSDLRSSFA